MRFYNGQHRHYCGIDLHVNLINDLELTIVREAKRHDADAFHRLRSVPGIGKVLALTILYEIHDITRFDRVQEREGRCSRRTSSSRRSQEESVEAARATGSRPSPREG